MKNSSYIKSSFLALLLLSAVSTYALDTRYLGVGSRSELFEDPQPYVTLEANYSKLLNRQVQFGGYGLGFDFNGASIGLTYYRLRSNVFTARYSNGADWKFRMNYLSLQLSQRLYQTGKWRVVAALGNGFGQINLQEGDVDRGKHGVYIFEPGVDARYTIVSWLGLSAQAGYRLCFPGGPPTIGDLSSTKFNIGFSIMAIPLYNAIQSKDFS